MDIQLLADQVVKTILPFLPYLLKGGIEAGKAAAGKLGEKFSDDAWEKAKSVWGLLHPKVEARPAAQEAALDAANHSADPDTLAALRLQVKKLLMEDEAFSQSIAALIQPEQSGTSKTEIHQHAGDHSIQVGTARDVNIKKDQ